MNMRGGSRWRPPPFLRGVTVTMSIGAGVADAVTPHRSGAVASSTVPETLFHVRYGFCKPLFCMYMQIVLGKDDYLHE